MPCITWGKARHVCMSMPKQNFYGIIKSYPDHINMHACCPQSRATVQPCMQTLILGIVHSAVHPQLFNDKMVSECVYSHSNSTHNIANINIATGITVNNSCIIAIATLSHVCYIKHTTCSLETNIATVRA